jgi:hypothetical protein
MGEGLKTELPVKYNFTDITKGKVVYDDEAALEDGDDTHARYEGLTFEVVSLVKDQKLLLEWASVCEYDPADENVCPSCAAYVRAGKLERGETTDSAKLLQYYTNSTSTNFATTTVSLNPQVIPSFSTSHPHQATREILELLYDKQRVFDDGRSYPVSLQDMCRWADRAENVIAILLARWPEIGKDRMQAYGPMQNYGPRKLYQI